MPDGILVIDKPTDWTSMDVCAKLKGILHERRIGHAGTLDPMATGVLPVFVGRATRAVEYASESKKEYVAALKLGVITNTQDITGEILAQRPADVSPEALETVLAQFRGDILQIPPMYSALKVNGQKLYDLARKGREVERKPRPVTIYDLLVIERPAPDEYMLRVRCSKGTYIRTLCHDIGAALGCGGCMSSLRRTMAAGFTLSDAVTLEKLQTEEDPASLLRPVDNYFIQYPALTVDGKALRLARNGNPFPCSAPDGDYRVYAPGGEFLLFGRCRENAVTVRKAFF